ncbi:molybdopterin-dependent oxidoreductase, partial [bacterium]|nr:molybdopterin-dependent oxidoreductase [bacterium]
MKKEYLTRHEIERYELESEPLYDSRMDRRQFFKILGGGILVFSSIQLPAAGALVDERREHAGERNPAELAAWLHIGQDGTVKVYTGKVEVGQNIRTSLSQAVAEELMVPMETIEMIMGDTFLTPYDRGTFGSLTTPTMLPVLRRAAASMREVLKELAAEKWNISAKSLTAIDGEIQNPKNKESFKYGALTEGKEIVREMVSDISTIPPEEWRIAGEPVRKVRGDEFVTGRHEYASDIQRAGMHHAKILRPPAFDAQLKMLDTSQAEAMPGVTVVREGNFVGVAAPSQAVAEKAVKALRAKWSTRPQIANKELFDHLKKTARGGAGSVEQGWKAADRRMEQTYHINYIAHTPLEPRAAVAEWDGDRLAVWTGTQRPFGVQDELSRAFDLPKEQIHVIMPDTGSGYGGKHTGEAAVEAARIARATGKPVKLNWTREEEFTWAYFRPAGVIDCKAGMKNDGRLTAWEFHNYNSGGSGLRAFYYAIPNKIE